MNLMGCPQEIYFWKKQSLNDVKEKLVVYKYLKNMFGKYGFDNSTSIFIIIIYLKRKKKRQGKNTVKGL